MDIDELRRQAFEEINQAESTDETETVETTEAVNKLELEQKAEESQPATEEPADDVNDDDEVALLPPEPDNDDPAPADDDDESLDDYLPPIGFQSDEPEEPVIPDAIQQQLDQLKRENDYMRQQAELLDMDISMPTLDLTPDMMQELQDTSPALARVVTALVNQVQSKAPAPAAQSTSDDPAMAETEAIVKRIPELNYWFNHKVDPNTGLVPDRIEKAQRIVINIEARLRNDERFKNNREARLKEAARLAVDQIKSNLEKRKTTRSSQSMSAAPGPASASEGSIERILALPATKMLAEIKNLPVAQQAEVRRRIGMV